MQEILTTFLEKKQIISISAAVLLVYVWSFFWRSSYLGFLSGVFTTLLVEFFLIWNYLSARIHRQTGGKINLELAKIEIKKVLKEKVDDAVIEGKMIKKKYYENNLAKPLIMLDNLEVPPRLEIKTPATSDTQDIPVSSPMEKNVDVNAGFSRKEINDLVEMRKKDQQKEKEKVEPKIEKESKKPNLEEKLTVNKLGRKPFISQVNDFMHILTMIGESEKTYGTKIQSFEFKYGLIITDESPSLMKLEEQASLDKFKLQALSEKDLSFLKKKFSDELSNKKFMYLPEWKKLKQTINFMGQIHNNCSKFIYKVSIPALDSMTAEYESHYEEAKNEKLRLTKEHEDALATYNKLKLEYDTQHKILETSVAEYQAKLKLKKGDEVVLKYEMKARLLKSQIDSLTNKLSNAEDKLQETKKALEEQNDKISKFIQSQNERKESFCCSLLKNVVSTLANNLNDVERSFDLLLRIESKPAQEVDKPGVVAEEEKEEDDEDLPKKKLSRMNKMGAEVESPLKKQRKKQVTSNYKFAEDSEEYKLVKSLEDFKITIEDFDITYNEDLYLYSEDNKKCRDLALMLKSLNDYEDSFVKEREKLVSFNFSNFTVNKLITFWKIVQNHLYFSNRLNMQMHEKLSSVEKAYLEFIKTIEKEAKAGEAIIQAAMKKANAYVKQLEKELLRRDSHKEKKDFLSRFYKSDKETTYNEDTIAMEKCVFLSEMEKGLGQITALITKSQKEAVVVKKDLLLSYLQCYTGQTQLFSELNQEAEKVSPRNAPQEEVKEDKEARKQNENPSEVPPPKNEEQSEKPPEIIIEKIQPPAEEQARPLQQSQPPTPLIRENKKEEERQGPENLIWFNKMFSVFALEWVTSDYFKQKITKTFWKSFNKKKSKYVRRINIKELIFEPKFPDIRSITPLPSDSFEFLYDIHMVYQGNVIMEIETRLEPQPITYIFTGDQPIPLTAKIQFKSFNGKVRLCWVPSEYGRSWYSFVGKPMIDLVVEPKIGASQFDIRVIPHVKTLILELINKKIRKMTYPYRKEIELPLATPSSKITPPPE